MSAAWWTPRHPWEVIQRPRVRHQYNARGRVWKRGDTWHMAVTVGDRVVITDNTGHWRTIVDLANEAVHAYDLVTFHGHKIKRSFTELTDAAMDGAA